LPESSWVSEAVFVLTSLEFLFSARTALILMQIQTAINLIIYGFFMWIIYGLIIGYLYRK